MTMPDSDRYFTLERDSVMFPEWVPDGMVDVTDEIAALRADLERMREQMGRNADELAQAIGERDALRAELDEAKREANEFHSWMHACDERTAEAERRADAAEAEVENMRPVFDQMGAALTHVVDNTTDWMDDSRGANVYEAYEAFETYRATSEQETNDA